MNTFVGIATVLAVLALGIRLVGRQHRLLHLLQLEHYEPGSLMSSLRRRHELFAPSELVPIAVLYAAAIVLAALGGSDSSWICGVLLLLTTPIAALGVGDWRRPAVESLTTEPSTVEPSTVEPLTAEPLTVELLTSEPLTVEPLKFTARVQRLLVAVLLPQLLLVLVAISLAGAGLTLAGLVVLLVAAFVLFALAPWTMVATNFALRPVQNAIDRHHTRQARHLLGDWAPLTICITGSHSETTKLCVGSVLSAESPTLVTGDAHDRFLNVVRAINEQLEWRHRSFVVGTSKASSGDRKELYELVRPKIGVITEISPVSPEQRGWSEEMATAGAELLAALPAEAHFVTNADDRRCLELAARATVPVTLFGIQDLPAADAGHHVLTPRGAPDGSLGALDAAASTAARASNSTPHGAPEAADAPASTAARESESTPNQSKKLPNVQVVARDIRLTENRMEFNLQLDGLGSPLIPVSAGPGGRGEVSSLLAAAAVGHVLGIEPARIVEGLAQMHPPPHPGQPIHSC